MASIEEPKKIKYKRPRSLRACLTCHQRKVKCNLDQTYPEKCTNCVQFNITECVLPEAKKRGRPGESDIQEFEESLPMNDRGYIAPTNNVPVGSLYSPPAPITVKQEQQTTYLLPETSPPIANVPIQPSSTIPMHFQSTPAQIYTISNKEDLQFPFLNAIQLNPETCLPKVRAQTARDFICSSTSSEILKGVASEFINTVIAVKKIDRVPVDEFDMNLLKVSGAFSLPEESLCWKYIDSFFEILHPLVPVINRSQFMRRYRDLSNPPSLLLLRAVLFSGARHIDDVNWTDEQRSKHEEIVMMLFKRAKALYDADVETDPIPLCQTFAIFTWSCEGKIFTSRTPLHWVKLAVSAAQSYRFHRDHTHSTDMSEMDKKLYKRIWWCMFAKDRYVSMALAQPFTINLDDCDVPLITREDMLDDEPGYPSLYPVNELHHQYFLHQLKVVMLFDAIVKIQNSNSPDIKHCDMLMNNYLRELPEILSFKLYDKSTHNIYSGTTSIVFYSLLIVVHKAELFGGSNRRRSNTYGSGISPSWSVMFKAGHMITCIVDVLGHEAGISQIVSFCVSHAASQFLLHLFNADPKISTIANQDILSLIKFLKTTTRRWTTGIFCEYVISKMYTDKTKLILYLKRVLPKEEFMELYRNSMLRYDGGDEYLSSSNIPIDSYPRAAPHQNVPTSPERTRSSQYQESVSSEFVHPKSSPVVADRPQHTTKAEFYNPTYDSLSNLSYYSQSYTSDQLFKGELSPSVNYQMRNTLPEMFNNVLSSSNQEDFGRSNEPSPHLNQHRPSTEQTPSMESIPANNISVENEELSTTQSIPVHVESNIDINNATNEWVMENITNSWTPRFELGDIIQDVSEDVNATLSHQFKYREQQQQQQQQQSSNNTHFQYESSRNLQGQPKDMGNDPLSILVGSIGSINDYSPSDDSIISATADNIQFVKPSDWFNVL
ncbi:hypothetical protein CANARDRAFT_10372 [[Candida] arabinofermentans NRRL YB-2248]|uniref:Zn(2)-C6 fungal-type domain-containing protein n=1 Tax=[Candida] arabinofermentans NRRL YB-2248 TaxID=983967 RepID=A0A1E4ST05_9ASCO|nr:hypothetical protein CANARDRAFT_10372 [[Candida] arabinofermentans NRRL YB-2248]